MASSALLVSRVDLDLDRWGAWVLVGCVGGALLLAGRGYRLPLARAALRVGGLGSWAALLVGVLAAASTTTFVLLAASSVTTAALLVLVAVAMVLVSTGIVRRLWETGSTMFSGGVTG